MAATKGKSGRYMDVLTMRSTQKADALSKIGQSGSSRTNRDHTKLLVEPVLLPDLNHLAVDDAREVDPPCLFYPTGAKNTNMRRSMEDMVRKVNAPDKPLHFTKSSTVLAQPKKKKVLDPNMPVEPLVYSRRTETDADVQYLLSRKGQNERNLISTVKGLNI